MAIRDQSHITSSFISDPSNTHRSRSFLDLSSSLWVLWSDTCISFNLAAFSFKSFSEALLTAVNFLYKDVTLTLISERWWPISRTSKVWFFRTNSLTWCWRLLILAREGPGVSEDSSTRNEAGSLGGVFCIIDIMAPDTCGLRKMKWRCCYWQTKWLAHNWLLLLICFCFQGVPGVTPVGGGDWDTDWWCYPLIT